jgi:fermentation-respiration switch protein FrsA (DUF1100 family)
MREHLLTPDRLGLAYRDVWFEAEDGVRVHGWFLPANGKATGTVLFLHGNAENISTHIASVAWLPGASFNVFLMDYRGYGLSEGSPSFDGLHRDVAAAIKTVFKLDGVDPDRVVLFGQSLGGALAITALARSPQRERLRALVVEGAPSSYRGLAQEKLAELWLTWPLQVPLSWTIDDQYRPVDAIAQVAPIPILIIQGEADPIVPPAHGKALFAAAREPKTLWLLPHTGHIRAFTSEENRNRLIDYLRTVDAGSTRGQRQVNAEVDDVNFRQHR